MMEACADGALSLSKAALSDAYGNIHGDDCQTRDALGIAIVKGGTV